MMKTLKEFLFLQATIACCLKFDVTLQLHESLDTMGFVVIY